MKKKLILYLICILFVSCASNVQNLQRESALNIGNNINPNDVMINNVNRGAMSVTWQAVVAPDGTIYNCDADDMVRRVNCRKQ